MAKMGVRSLLEWIPRIFSLLSITNWYLFGTGRISSVSSPVTPKLANSGISRIWSESATAPFMVVEGAVLVVDGFDLLDDIVVDF